MRYIAERHIKELEQPAKQPPTLADARAFIVKHYRAFTFGLVSLALYVLLFKFSPDLTQIAQETHAGHKGLFFIPIIIALVFSLIHGSFTSHFWDMLGVKAKTKAA